MSAKKPPQPPPVVDPDREAILARRRKFVASALAGLGLASCDPQPQPQVCLSPTVTPIDASGKGADAGATIDAPDAAPAAALDAGGTDAGKPVADPGRDAAAPGPCLRVAPPNACLKIAPPPQPLPCLTPMRKPEDK